LTTYLVNELKTCFFNVFLSNY